MKIEDNILFMQISPEDMTPNLREQETGDQEELAHHAHQAEGEPPSLPPDQTMEELDLKHIEPQK